MDASRGIPPEPLLGARRVQYDARTVAGLLAARPDTARVLLPRRRVAAVFDRQSQRARGVVRHAARSRGTTERRPHAPRHLSQIDGVATDVLDLRGHADADRPRLHVPLPPRLRTEARADRRLRRHPGRLLGGIRALSAAGSRLRLHPGWRSGRLAPPLFRFPRALQQELEPVVGVRHLVPESVSA